jgi:SAM-dependent methyltransferase
MAAPLLRSFDRRRLALLDAPPTARVLDAGAGRGRFVAGARAAGYDAVGIEPSPRSAAPGVVRASIEEASFEPGSFDAITLWHVLEHLADPGAALRRIAGWLAPGGTLLVGVPNLASWQARFGGPRWYHLDVPRHRTHFTPSGLEALLRASGFEPVGSTFLVLEHNPFGMWQSLVSRATRHPSYLYNVLKRNAPLRSTDLVVTAAALPLAPLAFVVELVAGVARQGGTVAVRARLSGGVE